MSLTLFIILVGGGALIYGIGGMLLVRRIGDWIERTFPPGTPLEGASCPRRPLS